MSTKLTNRPIPGQGLTTDPKNPQPHRRAPQNTELNSTVGTIFDELLSDEKLPAITKVLKDGSVFIDLMTSAYIEQGLVTGRWNSDMAHLLVEPVMMMFMWIGSQVGAPVKFKGKDHFDSGGFDVLKAMEEDKAGLQVGSLLTPEEEDGQ